MCTFIEYRGHALQDVVTVDRAPGEVLQDALQDFTHCRLRHTCRQPHLKAACNDDALAQQACIKRVSLM